MKKEFKIGIFAVVVIVASFFVLNYLRGEDIFNRELEYLGTYEDINGLVVSAPVYIKGYKAGKVTDVTYDKEHKCFNVSCSVSKQFDIPVDSRMVIYAVDIMGGRGVRIDPGSSDQYAEDGAQLISVCEAGLMDSIAEKISPLMDKVEKTIDSLGVTVAGVNRVLTENNTYNISKTLAHIEAVTANLQSISAQVNGKSSEIGRAHV